MVPLNFFMFARGLDIEAYRRISLGLLDSYSVLVDAFYNNFFKVSLSVRAKHHNLTHFNGTFGYNTSEDETNTFGLIARIDHKLGSDLLTCVAINFLLLVNYPCNLGLLHDTHESSECVNSFTGTT